MSSEANSSAEFLLPYFKLPVVFVEPLEYNIGNLMLDMATADYHDAIRKALTSANGTTSVATAPLSLPGFAPPIDLGVIVFKPM